MYYFLPVVVVITANAFYDICAKAIPEKINHFAGLTITYSCLAGLSFIMFIFTSGGTTMIDVVKNINWAVIVYGLASVGIETGYILLFRAGWNISLGGLVCNILLAISMITVGLLIFGENLSSIQFIGILLCIAGLVFINRSEISKSE